MNRSETDTQFVNGRHQTRAVPVDFISTCIQQNGPGNPSGIDADHVLLYQNSLIGKDLTLGWNGLNQVAQYTTHIQNPIAVTVSDGVVPIAYLNPQFSQLSTYVADGNLETPQLQGVQCPDTNGGQPTEMFWAPPAGYHGGVIASTQDGSAAIGFYTDLAPFTVSPNGPSASFQLGNFLGCNNPTTDLSFRLRPANLNPDAGPVPPPVTVAAGDAGISVYIVTGTKDQVKSLMQTLVVLGGQ